MADPASVVLSEVAVHIGGTPILRAIDLEVAAGEAVGISGANGSGKTTLLRVIATLLRPTTGAGTVLGCDIGSTERFGARPAIELVGHRPALYEHLTLRENLSFCASVNGASRADVGRALERVGLGGAADRRAGQASSGMLRRTEFARVWLTAPTLLLLDEAHAGLDDAAVALVEDSLLRVTAAGGAAVVVSHDATRAAPLVARQLRLDAGRLAEQ